MKKYKLLRDLPDVKAGTIWEINEEWITYSSGSNKYNYPYIVVENNPDFFAPYLLTTQDGVEIFKHDELYILFTEEKSITYIHDYNYPEFPTTPHLFFSGRGKAQEYLDNLAEFKVGDIVVYNGHLHGKSYIFKVTGIYYQEQYLLGDGDDNYLKKHCRKATNDEILEYHKEQVTSMVKISGADVVALIPERTYLGYVDYNDNLNQQLELLQKCVKKNTLDYLYEKVNEWFDESEWASLNYYKQELKDDLCRKYEIEEEEAEELIEKYNDDINEVIWDRNNYDVCKDLIKNTSPIIWYYRLEYDVAETCWMPNEELEEIISDIIKEVGIIETNNVRKTLYSLLSNASYGGELVIYFRCCFEELINEKQDFKEITFKGYNICCNNQWNGSGDSEYIKELLTLPFKRENIRMCKLDYYSYTYVVCGMVEDWCDDTIFELT
jgi:predicted transcriptional regulator